MLLRSTKAVVAVHGCLLPARVVVHVYGDDHITGMVLCVTPRFLSLFHMRRWAGYRHLGNRDENISSMKSSGRVTVMKLFRLRLSKKGRFLKRAAK